MFRGRRGQKVKSVSNKSIVWDLYDKYDQKAFEEAGKYMGRNKSHTILVRGYYRLYSSKERCIKTTFCLENKKGVTKVTPLYIELKIKKYFFTKYRRNWCNLCNFLHVTFMYQQFYWLHNWLHLCF